MKRVVETDEAPAAVGAYSQATMSGDLLFTAGQIPLTPEGNLLTDETVKNQTRQCLENLNAILESRGLTTENALKVTVYLADIEDFEAMDDAYREYFVDNPPARSAVGVEALPREVAVEIEAVVADE
jgi:reactive intermediate/imine deaminase